MTKEERAEYMREYAKRYRGYFSEKSMLWQVRHPDQVKRFKKAYRERNRERLNAQARERYAKNKEKYRAYQREYYYKSKLRSVKENV